MTHSGMYHTGGKAGRAGTMKRYTCVPCSPGHDSASEALYMFFPTLVKTHTARLYTVVPCNACRHSKCKLLHKQLADVQRQGVQMHPLGFAMSARAARFCHVSTCRQVLPWTDMLLGICAIYAYAAER